MLVLVGTTELAAPMPILVLLEPTDWVELASMLPLVGASAALMSVCF
jgi:hypothetical protein